MEYDIVIVGGGPSGLALAQCLRKTYSNILIIEKENSLGGCHRVRRVNYNGEMLFTEHGPRIYSSTYVNFQMLLKDMNSDFYDLFTSYNFSFLEIGNETIFSTLSKSEIFKLFLQFMLLILNDNHGINTTVGEFMEKNNFSSKSIDLINRITRLTDGAGADKYTLNEFLQLFNQNTFYKLFQPKLPNDEGLFKVWENYLVNSGIKILKNTLVERLYFDSVDNVIDSVSIRDTDTDDNFVIKCKKIVLAIPPQSILNIFSNSAIQVQNSILNFNDLVEYSTNTSYITYISITFHWDKDLKLPKIYGFPKSEWGIVFIVLSKYMTFSESYSKTVISCAVSIVDKKSKVINKTANESDENELISEVFRQLKESYPELPDATVSLISPGNIKTNTEWINRDYAYITSSKEPFLKFDTNITNLFNLGTQNGYQKYKFTSMESAVTNAIQLSHMFDSTLKHKYYIKGLFTVTKLIRVIIGVVIVIIILILWFRNKRNKPPKSKYF